MVGPAGEAERLRKLVEEAVAGDEDGTDEGPYLGFRFDFDVGVAVVPEKRARWKPYRFLGVDRLAGKNL